jgi:hypothetical protein
MPAKGPGLHEYSILRSFRTGERRLDQTGGNSASIAENLTRNYGLENRGLKVILDRSNAAMLGTVYRLASD